LNVVPLAIPNLPDSPRAGKWARVTPK